MTRIALPANNDSDPVLSWICQRTSIYLNGEKIFCAVEADDTQGWIRKYALDEAGRFRYEDEEFIIELVSGDVVIDLPNEALAPPFAKSRIAELEAS